LSLFCAAALRSLDQPSTTLSIALVEPEEMRALNFRYRQKDYATDVLSFSYGNDEMEGESFLGEIVIAPEVAVNQAIRHHISPESEMRMLLLHGILHLLGYDHESDDGRMNRIQTKLMRRKFFINGPLLTAKMQ
jgi:probable rRNA maturation factor